MNTGACPRFLSKYIQYFSGTHDSLFFKKKAKPSGDQQRQKCD